MSQSSSSSSSFVTRAPGGAAFQRAVEARVLLERGDVQPGFRVKPPGHVRDRDDLGAERVELVGGDPTDVAESLDDAPLLGELPAELGAGSHDDHHDPDSGRLVPEDGAADRDRLPGDDLGHRVAPLHRVRVHHPGHRLLVRGHVRRGNVLLRPDHRQEIGGEATRQPLDLGEGQRARVAADSSLRPAVGEAEQRAFPGHPHGERGALAEGHLEVVADPALRRPEDARVLDAISGEHDPVPLVHPDRDR